MSPGGAGGHVQDDEEGRRLGQRAVYVGIEAAERLHGRPRDQWGRVRHRYEAEAAEETDRPPLEQLALQIAQGLYYHRLSVNQISKITQSEKKRRGREKKSRFSKRNKPKYVECY